MTLFTHVIAFFAPTDHAEACNRAANAFGRTGDNFSIPLSAEGMEPATHLGGSTGETSAFLAAIAAAPNLPEGMAWPEALAVEDWQAVADHLVLVSAPAAETDARAQFAALIEGEGLQIIQTEAN